MTDGRTPLTVRHLLIMLAEIDRRYDALILDARLRRNGAEEYWKKEKEKWKVERLKY
ncbi:MAG: hypothetical protein ACI37N_01430 [Prevotella sp.]